MLTFSVQGKIFNVDFSEQSSILEVKSHPRPYKVEFLQGSEIHDIFDDAIRSFDEPLVLVDEKLVTTHLNESKLIGETPTMSVEVSESFKSLDGAVSVLNFMSAQKVGRGSTILVVGGGILQDVGAFAAGVYKRGVPWVYMPTTLLAQADSCIGSKSGLNFMGAKNVLGMFSAPRKVIIHPGFLNTLPQTDIESGLGEAFRLSIIGGENSLQLFEELLPSSLERDQESLKRIVQLALRIKRSVIEVDEFELDLRRSMNFGHSVGHAIEALTDYQIPHGTAVAFGLLVENEISTQRDMLPKVDRDRILETGSHLISPSTREILRKMDITGIVDVLYKDKKTEGGVLKLVVLQSIGSVRFIDFPLTKAAVPVLQNALNSVLEKI